jgi:hypothetical protein
MLRSVAFSSPSMNTPRFTPPTTKVEAKSPPTAQTQRNGNIITPKSILGTFQPSLELRALEIALRYGMQLPFLETRLNAIKTRHMLGNYGELQLEQVPAFTRLTGQIARVTDIIRERITSIHEDDRSPFLQKILLELDNFDLV